MKLLHIFKKVEPDNWQIYYTTWVLFQTNTANEVKKIVKIHLNIIVI